MKISFACERCGKQLNVLAKHAGRASHCPACHHSLTVPAFQPTGDEVELAEEWEPKQVIRLTDRRKWRWVGIALLVLIPLVGVTALVVVPAFLPKDAREVVVRRYFAAVRADDQATVQRLGVIDDPPLTHSVGNARQAVDRERSVSAPFLPIAELHAFVADNYVKMGKVYRKKDMTGMLAKTINMRAEVERQAQEIFNPELKPGQDPNDQLFDMAENYAKALQSVTDLVTGGLAHDSMVVTYEQVVREWGHELDPDQQELLESFRDDQSKWERMLGRDPRSIREQGQFTLTESVWETELWLPGQSWGETPVHTEILLRRFRLGLIDSGWKVWEIRTVD